MATTLKEVAKFHFIISKVLGHIPSTGLLAILFGPFLYLFVSNRVQSEAEALLGSAIFVASVVSASRFLNSLLFSLAESQRLVLYWEKIKEWLPPSKLVFILSTLGEVASTVFIGSLMATVLYVSMGLNWAIPGALWASATSFAAFVLLDFIFWAKVWRRLLSSLFSKTPFPHLEGVGFLLLPCIATSAPILKRSP